MFTTHNLFRSSLLKEVSFVGAKRENQDRPTPVIDVFTVSELP